MIAIRLCLLIAGVAFASGSAFAQTPRPAPETKPTAPAEDLSKKLKRSNGVIHPKEVDPGIEKPAPETHDPNVAPPPGTSGGDNALRPK